MHIPTSLFALPSSLLALLLVSPTLGNAQQLHERSSDVSPQHWDRNEGNNRRDVAVGDQQRWQQPTAVRKMSTNEGEMFFLDYWQYAENSGEAQDMTERADTRGERKRDFPGEDTDTIEDLSNYLNRTISNPLLSPLRPHAVSTRSHSYFLRFFARSTLERRDFVCPVGTNSCASINRPNSCCFSGQTCMIVQDVGLGDVGCCPQGTSCSGSITSCDTQNGFTSCPNSPNGGCCIPNYSCLDVGCIAKNTVTITALPPPTTSSSIRPSSSSPPPSSTITSAPTASPEPTVCTPGFRSCPASLGGGCCPTNSGCGSPVCPPLSTPAPPVRPTSNGQSISSLTNSPSSSSVGCPTGFYMCSAFYQGNCCRVGRDCSSTSCPPAATSTVVNSNGVTIIAPSAGETNSGCAVGWYRCSSQQGGNCCPSGFGCADTSCTATAGSQATGTVGQVPASGAAHVNTELYIGFVLSIFWLSCLW